MSDSTTRSGVIWVTGYSGAGKTTVARHVERMLRERGEQVIFLDGDDLRSIFARRWGYERDERIELANVYFRLSSHLASQGFVVVIAAVAMYDEVRAWVRANVPHSTVAYLDVPHDVRVERDAGTKRVYASGVDLEEMYDEPADPDVRVTNFGDTSPVVSATQIVDHFLSGPGRAGHGVADRGKGEHWNDYYATKSVARQAPSSFAVEAETRFPRGSVVLEVGCGNGRDTAYLAAQGHRVTALDASAAAIDLCRRTYGEAADFVAGVVPDHASQWQGTFDVLYSRFVIHAMTEEEEELALWADARSLMRPGGMLAVECRSINDPLARQGEVLSPTERIAGHYRRFIVLDDLVARLAVHGFTVEETLEARGLAVHQDDDPVVIRAFARA